MDKYFITKDDVLILNKYNIIENQHKDEFHIAIYYIMNNKCKIIIRRLDCNSWGQDLKIKIFDTNDNNVFEKISIGSSDENLKVLEIYTNIKLYPSENNNQLIPKIIIQTSNYNMNRNIYHYNSIMSFIELNPEYEYKFFNDNDCRKFLLECTDIENIIEAFDILTCGPIKAELFRYAYLYKNGGCYFDCKMILLKPLSLLIDSNDKLILINDSDILSNCMILCEKNNKYLLDILNKSIDNILKKIKTNDCRCIAGGKTFHNIIINDKDLKIKLVKNGDYIINHEKNIFLKYNYKEYYLNYYNTINDINYLWSKNELFFKSHEKIFNYIFYFYPNNYNDRFKIKHLKYNIFIIQRLDDIFGWGQDLKLKVINKETEIMYNIHIGNSEENEKPFVVE
jgi:mannosyltransferase OCH1-like enzyme